MLLNNFVDLELKWHSFQYQWHRSLYIRDQKKIYENHFMLNSFHLNDMKLNPLSPHFIRTTVGFPFLGPQRNANRQVF